MLFWVLLAWGQIVMRKIDGWKTLPVETADLPPRLRSIRLYRLTASDRQNPVALKTLTVRRFLVFTSQP